MPTREWTGSTAVLPESLRLLAEQMGQQAQHERNEPMREWLIGHTYTLREWADAVEQLYARRDEGLNAQGLALARLMAGRRGERVNVITNATFTLPEGWWLVTFEAGFECGIAPDGSVSS